MSIARLCQHRELPLSTSCEPRAVKPTLSNILGGCLLVCLAILVGCAPTYPESVEFPRKPIRVIVPFGAGGGSDTFTRLVQRTINEHELASTPWVIINVPGAGGGIGSRRVKNARPDGYTILQIHDGMLTNKYSGNTDFGPESFVPLAGTGRMAHVIAVAKDAEFQTLQDLAVAASQDPDSLVFAVGIGAPSHFAGMMLEQASAAKLGAEVKFRFAQSGGGAKRFASLLGGHSAITTFSVAEYVEFQASGVRALAVLSEDRLPQIPDVPTAREQGIDVVSTNMHFWWAPVGTSEKRLEILKNVIMSAMQQPELQQRLGQLATEPVVLTDQTLAQELSLRESKIGAVSQHPSMQPIPFGWIALTLSLGLGVVTFARGGTSRVQMGSHRTGSRLRKQLVAAAIILSYVVSLTILPLDYRLLTFLFMVLLGWQLAHTSSKTWPAIVASAFIVSLLLHFIFSSILVIDLP